MENFLSLAERCEEAAGPDRELDLEIAVRTNFKGVFGDPTVIFQWSAGGDEIDCLYPPENGKPRKGYLDPAQFVLRWTASLDAAMTLVPEGAQWSFDSHHKIAQVFVYFTGDHGPDCYGHEGEGYTPALALCAAALRARAASCDRNPKGEDPQGLRAKHESAVGSEADETP